MSAFSGKFGRLVRWLVVVVLIVAALAVGYRLGSSGGAVESGQADTAAEEKTQLWTCSMHPAIQLPKPGLCPICNMDLIPLSADDGGSGSDLRQISVSENAMKLMEVEVVPVERRFVTATVRMVGKVDYDETNLGYITAWIPGRLDRLFVDYTGLPVRKGDHMVSLYSPELISAQEELLQAIAAAKNNGDGEPGVMQRISESTARAAREKLRLWGLTAEQIGEIEKTGKVSDHMTIYAPKSGIVIHKNALEGMYVETGTRIYTIANLGKVWVKLDAYESDLEWLRYGQEVEFTTVSYPGRAFKGTISFIDPILDEKTRTVKVRVNVSNPDGMLKPGMFVKALVRSEVASGGRIMDADLAGKWICPMHPEIVKDGAAECDICEMPLVRTEELGYVSADAESVEKPLVIPVSAALVTGKRAVVYVQVPDAEKPTFEGRDVALGPRAGDYYLVRDGLDEGELVVVNGNFKIDSSLQIMAKPSMMTPEPAETGAGHDHAETAVAHIDAEFRVQLGKVFDVYFAVQEALAGDDAKTASAAAGKGAAAVRAVDMKLLSGEVHDRWMKTASELEKILGRLSGSTDIKTLREDFYLLSQQMMSVAREFGATGQTPIYITFCPMAFDDTGARWIQRDRPIRNPYFGDMMLECGVVEEIVASKDIWQ